MSAKADSFVPPPVATPLAEASRRLAAGEPAPKEPKRSRKKRPTAELMYTQAFDTLYREWFAPSASFRAWRAAGAAMFGEPLTATELKIYQECTGRTAPPTRVSPESWYGVGRRGGKGWFIASVADFLACERPPALKRGERGVVMVMAVDTDQAAETFNYIKELLLSIPTHADMVVGKPTKNRIDLTNGVRIQVQVANWRRIRGRKVLAAVCDEVAFWWSDESSANADKQILDALRPSMLGVPSAMLLGISSTYAQRGELWDAYRRHYGRDGDPVLFWKAPTWTMNPSADQAFLDREKERDPVAFDGEYGANFRTDLASYIGPDVVDRLVRRGLTMLPPSGGKHVAFIDTAGGGGKDSLALGLARFDPTTSRSQLVYLNEWRPPFSAVSVAAEIAAELKSYGVAKVTGDKFSGSTWADLVKQHAITYEFVERSKSDLYHDVLPILTSERVELLDHRRMLMQLVALERRTGSSGRDIITHPPRGNDDVCNAAMGALLLCHEAATRPTGFSVSSFTTSRVSFVGENASPTNGRTWTSEQTVHPHERDYDRHDQWDADRRMGRVKADRWRAVWTNNGQRPA